MEECHIRNISKKNVKEDEEIVQWAIERTGLAKITAQGSHEHVRWENDKEYL